MRTTDRRVFTLFRFNEVVLSYQYIQTKEDKKLQLNIHTHTQSVKTKKKGGKKKEKRRLETRLSFKQLNRNFYTKI